MEWSWARFLLGAIGALAPEVVRIYRIESGGTSGTLARFGRYYYAISLLFAGFAGVFAVAWGEGAPFKSIWVGASFPTIVSTLASQVPPFGSGTSQLRS